MATKKQRIILSLGGSLLVQDRIRSEFMADFVKLIQSYTALYSFVIFCGGGKTARNYQNALAEQGIESNEAKDWVGIQSSILNATLLAYSFRDLADKDVITDPRVKLSWKKSIYIGAGWKPGRSTDYDAVRLAQENDVPVVINISNIDYVYDKDPRKYKTARKLSKISWADMKKVVGSEWTPGMNVPFDPIAAKLAHSNNISVKFVHGDRTEDLKNAIVGGVFEGTEISNANPSIL